MGAGRTHGNLLLLFDLLAKMTDWDADSIRKLESIPGNPSLQKGRLMDLILRSLRLLYEKESQTSVFSLLFEEAKQLSSRKLFAPARKRLKKARKICIQLELETQLLNLVTLEQEIFVQSPHEPAKLFYDRLEKEERECLESLQNFRTLHRLHERMRDLARKTNRIKTEAERNAFEEIIQSPIMHKGPFVSFKAYAIHQKIIAIYHSVCEEHEEAWTIYHTLLGKWNDNQDKIPHYADLYLGTLNNYLNSCMLSPDHRQYFLQAIETVRTLSDLPAHIQLKFQRVTFSQELAFRVNWGSFDEGTSFFQELETWLTQQEKALSAAYLLVFYYNIASYFFAYGENRTAYHWLLKILHFPKTEARHDIRDFARIFQTILQFELGNMDLQEYLLRSAYRYFRRNESLFEFEEAIISFLKTAQKSINLRSEDTLQAYSQLLEKLTHIQHSPHGSKPMGLELLIYWVESKIAGVDMRIYFEKKVNE